MGLSFLKYLVLIFSIGQIKILYQISWRYIKQLTRYFNQKIKIPTSWWYWRKSQGITKVIKVHLLGTMNAWTTFWANPFWCWDISLDEWKLWFAGGIRREVRTIHPLRTMGSCTSLNTCCRIICYDMHCAQVEREKGFIPLFFLRMPMYPFQIKQMGQPFVPAEYFYLPYLKGIWHALISRVFQQSKFKMLSGFEWVGIRQILTWNISMLGKIIVNAAIHRKEKQQYLHYTVCGADHPGRIICALTEQNLNRPQLISGFLPLQFSIPQVPYSMF